MRASLISIWYLPHLQYHIIATRATTKMELLNSVIKSLQKAELSQTTALAHALILRADLHLESIPQNSKEALEDAMQAVEINDLNGRAYRVVADAREGMGDVMGAMEAVSTWALKNPSFAAKAKKELDRLSRNK